VSMNGNKRRQTPLKNLLPLIDGCRRIETRLETGF
jgi:hypothetical protein